MMDRLGRGIADLKTAVFGRRHCRTSRRKIDVQVLSDGPSVGVEDGVRSNYSERGRVLIEVVDEGDRDAADGHRPHHRRRNCHRCVQRHRSRRRHGARRTRRSRGQRGRASAGNDGRGGNGRHLESTHHRYLWAELPRLSALATLRADLEPHLTKEEQVLFPMARELAATETAPTLPFGSATNPVSVLLAEHDVVGDSSARSSVPPTWPGRPRRRPDRLQGVAAARRTGYHYLTMGVASARASETPSSMPRWVGRPG